MERYCGHCGELFDKEPGYFYGAMFVSYALMAGWFILWYALNILVIHMSISVFLTFFALTVIGLSPFTFRWSRSLWINIFVRFDKSKKGRVPGRKQSDQMKGQPLKEAERQ